MELTYFLDKLASKEPTPGGGGAAALAGAVGIALGNMTGSLTVGKRKYAAVEEDVIELNKRAQCLRKELYELIRRDAEAFMPVSRAYSIPKSDLTRGVIMEEALKGAAEVPFQIIQKCCEALDIIVEYEKKGSAIAISDVGCAATMCKSAIESAALNVYVNTMSMKDRDYAETLNNEVKKMSDQYVVIASEVYKSVMRRLR